MNIKLVLYCIFIPFSIWLITSINLEKYFKKNNIMQINCFYMIISVIISYLLVNFFYDIYTSFLNI